MTRVRTRIKICGIRDHEAALAAADAGADALGFVFVESSPRFIDPDDAAAIMYALPPMVTPVGVVRDLSVDEFGDLEQACPCVLMQLHGDEDDKTVAQCGPGIIRAIRFNPETIDADLKRWSRLTEVDAILVDGSAGGEGASFDWNRLADAARATPLPKPIIVAGGLNPDNVAGAIAACHPWAVDVSSGVESAPGVKDLGAVRAFCEAVRDADAAAR